MKSVQKTVYHKYVVQKSIFHNYLLPIHDVDEIDAALKTIQQDHPGASHYCTAYIIGQHKEIQKYNDDGEPSQTAGLPMLEVLKKNDLTDVLAVSVRFFGGIKLGAGGLIRAYAKGVAQNTEHATFTTLKTVLICTLTIPFDEIGHVEHFVRSSYHLINTEYTEHVTYTIKLLQPRYQEFYTFFKNQTNGKARIKEIDSITQFM
jgi:uncharacterized YigZ family protein